MMYSVESVIKRLQNAQKEGKGLINESELICIATPTKNNIDKRLNDIEKAIKWKEKTKGNTFVSIPEFGKITGIPKQTLYRWGKDGLMRLENQIFDIKELKETFLLIQKRHQK